MKLSIVTRLTRAVGALGIAFATLVVASTPAHAATHYTPDAGAGDRINFVGTSVMFRVTSTGQPIDCDYLAGSKFDIAGSVFDPGTTRSFGTKTASVSSLTATNCINWLLGATAITPQTNWTLAITGPEVADVSPATLSNIDAYVNMANCKFYVTGSISGSFNEATQQFTPSSSSLTIASGNRAPVGGLCTFIGVAAGGSMTADSGTYWTNTPPAGSAAITITNP